MLDSRRRRGRAGFRGAVVRIAAGRAACGPAVGIGRGRRRDGVIEGVDLWWGSGSGCDRDETSFRSSWLIPLVLV